MSKPLVSIIILNYNGLKDTLHCLESVKKTTYPNFEVLLVDNGSDKNEGEILQNKFGKKYKVILLKKNLGYTGGNNLALKKAQGKYIILLNNDTEVTPNWISPLVDLLEKDGSIAVVQPKIKMLYRKNYFDYAGAAGGFIDSYGYPFTRGRIFESKEKDTGQYDKETIIFWASGAACIIRKSTINKVGGLFDPIFFNYMEEIDFCWRVWKNGYKVYFCPNSTVYHKGAATAGRNLFEKRYWEHRNNLLLLYKNLEQKINKKVSLARLFLELATYFRYLIYGNFTYLKSLFFAHKDFISWVIKQKVKKNKAIANHKIPVFPSSVAINYYLLGHDTFNKLNWSPNGNVSFLIYNTKLSGGLKIILSQANDLVLKGYRVNIYKIFGSDSKWTPEKTSIRNIIYYYFTPRSDALIFTFWPTSYLHGLLNSKEKYYFVMDSINFYKNSVLKALLKHSFKFHLKFITISSYLKKEIKKFNKRADVETINTSLLNYKKFSSKKIVKKSLKKKIRVLSVISNYEYYKGIDLLTKTVLELKKRNKHYSFTLVSREKYKYDDIFDNFHSGPPTKKLVALYQQSDVLLATSRAEGLFIPGLEAMAAGCVFITTNCYGILDYAVNNFNSIIVKDIREIWEKDVIYKTLNNFSLRRKLAKNGYNTVKLIIKSNKNANLEDLLSLKN
jgi:hypothetical protein